MAGVSSTGLPVRFTKDIGSSIRLVARDELFTQMEMSMKATGLMTRLTAKERTTHTAELYSKAHGSTTSKRAKDLSSGLAGYTTKELTKTERNMGVGNVCRLTSRHMRANFRTTTFTVLALVHGLTVVCILENGKTIRCMAKETSRGQTDGHTAGNT
jgi:hypothetical protein